MNLTQRLWRGLQSPAARLDEQHVRPLLFLYLTFSFLGEFSGLFVDLVRHWQDPALPAYYAQSWLNMALAIVWLLLIILGQWMETHTLVAALIGSSLLGGTVVVYVLGGIRGPLPIYYLIPALLGFLYFEGRGILLSIAATMLAFLALFYLENGLGQLAPQIHRSNLLGVHAFIVATGLLAVITLVALLVISYRSMLLEQVDLRQKLTREMEAKENFLARVSHELRTPITSLVGFAELLRQEASQDDGMLRQGIYLNSLNLLTMINNLLDFNKVEQGHFVMEPRSVEVPRLVEELRIMLLPGLQEKGLDFVVHARPDPFPVLIIDPVSLERILVNLVSNAIKHTEEGGIEVFVHFHAGVLELRIEDTGKGLDAATAARVFEAYYQAPGQKTGTGLGLALVKELVERAGGSVELFSTLGEGTQVRVTLPAVVGGARGRSDSPAVVRPVLPQSHVSLTNPDPALTLTVAPLSVRLSEENTKNAEIAVQNRQWLFVEDQPDIRTMIRLFLDNLGYEALICSSWEEVKRADLTQLTRAWVDLRLPEVDGFVICAHLKEANAAMIVKAMTAQLPDDGEQGLAKKGFDGILMKPFTLDQLRRELEDANGRQDA